MGRIHVTPLFLRRFNGWSVGFWIVITIVQIPFGWADSVEYVSILSTWALVMSSLGAHVAARVEVVQAELDLPTDVVNAIVENTTINTIEE